MKVPNTWIRACALGFIRRGRLSENGDFPGRRSAQAPAAPELMAPGVHTGRVMEGRNDPVRRHRRWRQQPFPEHPPGRTPQSELRPKHPSFLIALSNNCAE
ncbi:hypothetical protein GDO81_022548 [Engystomops pustulosus]|uniref:Uncharacterized protein n=1 Tax=Engystomops pustulosus TaxID=76066 RepID=A0AAV6Z4A5_ENGPU|nr:hypothetical protein GDO81_022548 [Engystomops pustulosus]KAG8544405.1 hypothetical protein GDO81_022548 [Engystomops pustulosus]